MTFSNKHLSAGAVSLAVFVSAAAWAESACTHEECTEMTAQLDLLRAQIGHASATIKKLETDLTLAKQDISLLQNNSSNRMRATGDIQRSANGHGR